MARQQTNERTEIVLPADKGEASRWVYQRLCKLAADRRSYADAVRDAIKDAKQDGLNSKIVRTAMRLDRMTPEKRETWAKEIQIAAKLFGYSGLEVSDADKPKPLWGLIETVRYLENDRRDVATEMKEIVSFVRETRPEIDIASINTLVRMAKKDRDEQADWFAGVDTMATFLGIW